MKKIFSIIGLVQTLFFVFFLFANLLQAQDWIKNHPGIPLETGLDWDWVTYNSGAVDSMKLAGVDIVRLGLANNGIMNTITNWNISGFRVLPFKSSDASGNIYNYIQHYTDAKYSVWEAEGSSLGDDDAQLVQKDVSKTEIYHVGNSTLVRRKDSVANSVDTLTEGPYYVQDVHYYASQDGGCDPVTYRATFSLMLQNNTPAVPYNPSDIICVLQVTYSRNDSPFHLDTTITIGERIVRRYEFDNLDVIDTLSIDYDLASTIPLESPDYIPDPQNTFKADLGCPGLRDDRKYIQFKVIWNGNSNANGKPGYLLSFDKVVVSDLRGRELVDSSSEARSNIELQDQNILTYAEDLVGWMGIDEPVSIDIFEPIRIVKEVLAARTNNARPLRIPFMGSWSGYWDAANNIFGAMGKSKWKVFGLRVGETNIIQNFYMYDYPYRENGPYPQPVGETINEANIRVMAELNYKQAYELDPNFGVSIQCGANNNDQSYQRNIKSHELLYNVNLALMYGAKFIELWNYFAQSPINDPGSGLTYHGIVDWESNIQSTIYTDKYFTLRDTIRPRLNGLMGKTLKTLTATEQVLNAEYLIWHNYISLSIHYSDADYGKDFDIGFFKDGLNRDYFMLANRWYNLTSAVVPVTFNPSYFNNYNNFQIYNLIDSTKMTIQSSQIIYPTIELGDALFYRVAPVVRSGGSLITNETTIAGETLRYDMFIENGATLTVNGTYNAKANITVKNGGKIVAGTNSKIVFDPYKKLIVQGITEIKGQSNSNRLTLEFLSSEKGIELTPGSSFTLQYCNLTGAYYGISTITSSQYYVNISNSNISTGSVGIALTGNLQGAGLSGISTSTIYKCNFPTWGTGISVSNYSSILIKENTFTSSGIYISNVPSAFIQSNNFSLGTNTNLPVYSLITAAVT